MQKWQVIHKYLGETPLQALEGFRRSRPELASLPLTYAGRLDPMAEGKLLILVGDECKKKEFYNRFDKEYEFEMLLGVESDTGDVLGLVEKCESFSGNKNSFGIFFDKFLGVHQIPYPAFSSKPFRGKPLFEHALRNDLPEKMPLRRMKVCKIQYLSQRLLSSEDLLSEVVRKINSLKIDASRKELGADFRREDVLRSWESLCSFSNTFQIVRGRIIVSSGSYIRAIIPLIGKNLDSGALVFSLNRICIGKYWNLWRNFGFWLQSFG